jgi:hypothetical protein
MIIVTAYLAIFFCALATYTMLLVGKSELAYFNYVAVVNALVVAKVILIGEAAHLGKEHEDKPLIYSCIYKAFLWYLACLRLSFRRGNNQAAYPWARYRRRIPRRKLGRAAGPQCHHFLYFHPVLCI